MHTAFQLAPGPIYRQEKPVRNDPYRRFIKRFPCVACYATWWIDPAHTGSHAFGRKGDDRKAIPLCRQCHREFDADPREFAARHGLDIPALIRFFNHLWDLTLPGASTAPAPGTKGPNGFPGGKS